MRKILAGLFISLDGVIEAPHEWHFPYYNEQMGAVIEDQTASSDTLLFGRQTYEEFFSYWPQQSSDVQLADYMNHTPKLVASSTLDKAEWNNSSLLGSNVAEELTKLKEQRGKNIYIVGSATLVRTLLAEGVLDELQLLVHPIVVGSGKQLFPSGSTRTGLKLRNSETFSTGVMHLTYGPA